MQAVPKEPLAISGMQWRDTSTECPGGRSPRFEGINGETRQAYADSIYGEDLPNEASQSTGRQGNRGEARPWQAKTPQRREEEMKAHIAIAIGILLLALIILGPVCERAACLTVLR